MYLVIFVNMDEFKGKSVEVVFSCRQFNGVARGNLVGIGSGMNVLIENATVEIYSGSEVRQKHTSPLVVIRGSYVVMISVIHK